MQPKELMQKLILGELTLSQALTLTKIQFKDSLSEQSYQWLEQELNNYVDASQLPEYRMIECSVKASLRGFYGGIGESTLDTSVFSKWQEESDVPYAYPTNMCIYQGIESIEATLDKAGSYIRMELNRGQIDMLLKYYHVPPGYIIEKMYQECRVEHIRNIIYCVRNKLISILQAIDTSAVPSGICSRKEGKKKKVFISYSWDSDEHKAWVKGLAERLSKHFDVIIDIKTPLGTDLNVFMEQMVGESDRVLLILTPNYKEKADKRINGVGYESVLISGELYSSQGTTKFIPIIRKGEARDCFPRYLMGRKGLEMINDDMFERSFIELVNDIKNY